ncbi:MAG: glutathione ABC transporter substrate-binding protein [Trueperaceae bacterium]|jgi:ABC-type transport system substrate-binding protein
MLRTALRALSVVVLAAGVFAWSAAQTLTIALPVEPASIDAHIPTDSPSAMVTSHIFDTLYRWDSVSGQIVPHLATSATMSDDGMSWTLVLRDDVVFHNGLPFNAEVVKGSMERLFDPATAAPFAWILGITESIDVVDEYTVRFNLSSPFAPFLSHLTHSGVAIVHPDVVAELGERHYEEPVGTGPFRVVNWDRGNRVVLERFDGYWGEAPGIEQLIFRTVPEDTTRVAMLESGEVDVARVPAQDVARVDANPNVTVSNVSGVRTIFIYFNHTKEPFTDVRVRQAMNHAINMDEIADFVHGGTARPSDAAIAPGIFGYAPVGRYAHDPERARELLAEAGYPNGFDMVLHSPTARYPGDIQTSEAIQSQLAEVGINATIETMEWTSYIPFTGRPVEENEVQMAMLGWGTVTGDADYGLYALFHTSQHAPAGFNRGFYSNAVVDALLDEARTSSDTSLRQQAYTDVLELLYQDAAWLFLHSEAQLVGVRNDVEGLVIHPTERYLAHGATKR